MHRLLHWVDTGISIFIYKVPTCKPKSQSFCWLLVQPFSAFEDVTVHYSVNHTFLCKSWKVWSICEGLHKKKGPQTLGEWCREAKQESNDQDTIRTQKCHNPPETIF